MPLSMMTHKKDRLEITGLFNNTITTCDNQSTVCVIPAKEQIAKK